jgi:lipopolysaccharide transport system permease protein
MNKIVYTPESQMRNPRQLLTQMWRDLKASRELAWRLFVRDISAQYRQSLLGILWAFFPPIVSGIVFIILQSNKVINFGETDIPYPVFVLVGTTLWQLFIESLNAPLKSVTLAKPMLAKINFPREALIVSALYQTIFGLLIKFLIIAGVFLIFRVEPTRGILLAPLAILMLILHGMLIGLLLTPIGALYTDIQLSLVMITQLWFFATPVVYPAPQKFPYSLIATLNPVSPLLVAARDLLTKGTLDHVVPCAVVAGLTLAALLFVWVLYRIALPVVIERMSQ